MHRNAMKRYIFFFLKKALKSLPKRRGRSEYEGCLTARDGQLMINMASRNLDDAGVDKWCPLVSHASYQRIRIGQSMRENGSK